MRCLLAFTAEMKLYAPSPRGLPAQSLKSDAYYPVRRSCPSLSMPPSSHLPFQGCRLLCALRYPRRSWPPEDFYHTGVSPSPCCRAYRALHQCCATSKRRSGDKSLSTIQFSIPTGEFVPVTTTATGSRQASAAASVGDFRCTSVAWASSAYPAQDLRQRGSARLYAFTGGGLALPSRSARQAAFLRLQLLCARRDQEPQPRRSTGMPNNALQRTGIGGRACSEFHA